MVFNFYVVKFASEQKKQVYGYTFQLCEKCAKYYEEYVGALIEKKEIVKTHCQRCGDK
jgi:hypothetical protein